jgi:acylphosphatase
MGMHEGRRAVLISVSGRVQGVWYRASAQAAAARLGVAGWARNLPGGEVEVRAEGSPEAVDRMIAWCRQGPPAALVESVAVREVPVGGLAGFEIRR